MTLAIPEEPPRTKRGFGNADDTLIGGMVRTARRPDFRIRDLAAPSMGSTMSAILDIVSNLLYILSCQTLFT
jgi:hypothetical protein